MYSMNKANPTDAVASVELLKS